jgi:hypothetical protein
MPDLCCHCGGAAPVKLREIGWCVFREDPPEEVRGCEQFTSLV